MCGYRGFPRWARESLSRVNCGLWYQPQIAAHLLVWVCPCWNKDWSRSPTLSASVKILHTSFALNFDSGFVNFSLGSRESIFLWMFIINQSKIPSNVNKASRSTNNSQATPSLPPNSPLLITLSYNWLLIGRLLTTWSQQISNIELDASVFPNLG